MLVHIARLTGCSRPQGVNPYMEDLLKNPKLVQDALNMGLVVIPWGPNDKAGVRQLKEMGVDGVIYDRYASAVLPSSVQYNH